MAKILLVANAFCGGAERMTILYGKIFEKAGHEVEILFLKNSQQKANELLPFVPTNWKAYTINCRYSLQFLSMAIFLIWHRQDYIFSSMGKTYANILKLKKRGLIQSEVIVRCNNMPSFLDGRWNTKKILTPLYPLASSIIAQTQEMKKEMMQYYNLKDEDITVINNPIDTNLIEEKIKEDYPFDKSYINYVAIGRITPQKDYVTMLRAFDLVHKANPKTRLYILGHYNESNPHYQSLQSVVKESNIGDTVFFEGQQSNPFKYLKDADCFCLSSEIEGLPNVMLEAMYLGVPVAITESIPFIKQTVMNGRNGYTCPIHDFNAFADCMINACKIKGLPIYTDAIQSENRVIQLIKK